MSDASAAIRFALNQIGKPYVWGAQGPNSYDCSGLMVDAYQHGNGITLPRTTQAMLVDPKLTPVNKGQLRPGDLVFPSTEHVQMYLGGGKVVEAPHTGLTVRVSTLGTVYAARRVTAPATGSYGATPVSSVTPVGADSGSQVESVASQAVGAGLTKAFGSLIAPVLKWSMFIGETGIGLAIMAAGVFLIAVKGVNK